MKKRIQYPLAVIMTGALVGMGLWMAQNPVYAPLNQAPQAAQNQMELPSDAVMELREESNWRLRARSANQAQQNTDPFTQFGEQVQMRVHNAKTYGVEIAKESAQKL